MYRFITILSVFAALFLSAEAQAQAVDQTRNQFAHQIYASAATEINHDAPQPMLRAVVVMKIKLSDAGRWTAEVVRDNPTQPEMTQKALDSVQAAAAPAGLAADVRASMQREGFMEVWLFQSNGRFALRTLALPQRDS